MKKKSEPSPEEILIITIRSKEKLLYSGKGNTVSSENESGPFDVLYRHANFVSLIFHYVIVDKGLSTEASFQMDRGVMYVSSGKVDIYVGI